MGFASPTPRIVLSPARRRLDAELVRRGLVSSREQAVLEVAQGNVLVSGAPALKVSRLIGISEPLKVLGPGPRFVSRGGEKLDAALEHFGVEVRGSRALDAGSSTGGFVDCLLQRGAAHVVAIDVGRGQLEARLREDPRVLVREGVNIRWASPSMLEPNGPVDVLTADLSFISLCTVANALAKLVRPSGQLLILVKPQFEAGRSAVSKAKGVIRDPALWRQALVQVASALGSVRTGIIGVMASPLRGPAGNVEFFLHAIAEREPTADRTLNELIDAALASVSISG